MNNILFAVKFLKTYIIVYETQSNFTCNALPPRFAQLVWFSACDYSVLMYELPCFFYRGREVLNLHKLHLILFLPFFVISIIPLIMHCKNCGQCTFIALSIFRCVKITKAFFGFEIISHGLKELNHKFVTVKKCLLIFKIF